jgi:drug/metabolite transporter (DMT)-like permease
MPLPNALMLLALGTIWGASYLFIKVGVAEITPLTIVAMRTGLAAVVLVLVLRLRKRSFPKREQWAGLAAMGLFNALIPYGLITWGETYISSGLAAILNASMPLFTVILAHYWSEGERMNRFKALGVVTGFVGVVLLLVPDLRNGVTHTLLGDLAVVGASLSYAIAGVYAHRRFRGEDPAILAVGQNVTGFAMTAPLAFLLERPLSLSPSLKALGAIAALAVVGTAVAYLIYYWILNRGGSVQASLVTYIIPVGALFWGWLLLHEGFHWTSFVGLAIILVGIMAVNGFRIVRTSPRPVRARN